MVWCSTLFSRHRTAAGYVFNLVLIAVLFIPYFFLVRLDPYERVVWRDDRSIMYPHKTEEIVPNWVMPFIAFGLPTIIITVWLGVKRFSNKKMLVAYLGLLLSLMVTVEVTTLLKQSIGRPRPDFLARCDADPTIIDRVVCRGDVHLVKEGRRSFPSGHTSAAFAGLAFSGYFLAGQLDLFSGEGYIYRFVLCLLPFLVAGFVGVSRIMDYRHHWQDVVAGALLGSSMAYLAYRLYFPEIMSHRAETPPGRLVFQASKDDEIPAQSRGVDSV